MSIYSVGKNELRNLANRETDIKNELQKLNGEERENVCSFRSILLNNEMSKIQNKMKVLSFGNPSEDDDIA
ncbi:MAG: hypothetical protein IJ599_03180 [Alphaproteobacteria bacterium]|nr:hypothetical protein [Alphaproteobacteria bacterium]